MSDVPHALWTLLVLVLAGVALRRIAGEDGPLVARGLGAFAFRLGIPALLIVKLSAAPASEGGSLLGVAIAYGAGLAAAAATGFAIAWWSGAVPHRCVLLATTAAAPNAGYLGLPLALALVGAPAIPVIGGLILYDSVVTVTMLTIAISAAATTHRRREGEPRTAQAWAAFARLPFSPLIQASIVGLLLRAFGLQVPALMTGPLDALADATVPLALVALGAALPVRLAGLRWKVAWPAVVGKLFVQPLVCLALALAMGLVHGAAMQAALVVAAAPIGLNVLFVAQGLKIEEELATSLILLSTVGCIVTLPLFLGAMRLAGG